jgi:hypothetical protein
VFYTKPIRERRVPGVVRADKFLGVALLAVGVPLCLWGVTGVPDASQGGPAVAYAVTAVIAPVGAGGLAVAAGLYALGTGATQLPASVLAGIVAVGLVSAVFSARLLLWLPATAFAVLAVVIVVGSVLLALRVTQTS